MVASFEWRTREMSSSMGMLGPSIIASSSAPPGPPPAAAPAAVPGRKGLFARFTPSSTSGEITYKT